MNIELIKAKKAQAFSAFDKMLHAHSPETYRNALEETHDALSDIYYEILPLSNAKRR